MDGKFRGRGGGETQLRGREDGVAAGEGVSKGKSGGGLWGDRDVRGPGLSLLITGCASWSSSAQPGTGKLQPCGIITSRANGAFAWRDRWFRSIPPRQKVENRSRWMIPAGKRRCSS